MKKIFTKALAIVSLMLISICANAATVMLSNPTENGSVHGDADGIVTLKDVAEKGGIQTGSITIQGKTCMKLSGSRQFSLSYSSDVTINSVKLYAISNGNSATTVGTNSNDKDSYGSTNAKGGDVKEFTLTGVDGEGLYFSGQSNAVIVVDYTLKTTKTEVSRAATGIKVNGSAIEGAAFDSDNMYVLENAYILPPTVAVIQTITYSDATTKDEDISVTLALNAEKSYYEGTVEISETEYTVKVPVGDLSETRANVTGATTWDWTKTGTSVIQLSDDTYPSKSDKFVLGNLIPNTANFNSNALLVQTEYAVRDGKYYQGGYIKFTTTVPGTIKVTFSNTGDRKGDETQTRYLYVNNVKTEWGANNATMMTTGDIAVDAGDVELTAYMSSSTNSQYIRISKIVFTPVTSVSVPVNATGISSFCSDVALDFTDVAGIEAYAVTDVGETSVKLTKVTKVAAGEGIFVKGITTDVPVATEAVEKNADNLLVGTTVATEVEENFYALSASDGKVHPVTVGGTIAKGKAYLVIASPIKGGLSLDFDDDATAADVVEAAAEQNVEVKKFFVDGQLLIQTANGLVNAAGAQVK